MLVLVVGVAIILLIAPSESGHLIAVEIYESIGHAIQLLWTLTEGWLPVWGLLALVLLLLIQLYGSGLTYLCITIGSILAKKHKLLAGIGLYYLVNMVVSFVGQFFMMFLLSGVLYVIAAAANAGGAVMGLTISAVLLCLCAAVASAAAVLHFTTLGKLERKLNLA